MRKVLCTGVAGFIGSNLAFKLLQSGYAVIGIDNLSSGHARNIPGGVEFHQADIRDQAIYPLFREVDTVFHLAAKNCLADCLAHPVEASEINVTGTVNVLEAARAAKVRKLIYADTSAEYEGLFELPSKVDKVHPISPYAVSKRGGGIFCETYQRLFGMNITTLRYFNVYGPVQDWRRSVPPVMSAFILKLLRGEPPVIYGDGQKRRDFIYVDDVNAFHLMAVEDPRTDGRVFNVGSGTNHSIFEIYESIERMLRTGFEPLYQPNLVGEAQETLADTTDSIALGWRPKVDLEEGLRRSIAYIREKVLGGERATVQGVGSDRE